ncbi:MAG: HIT domain-containing protein [Nitrospinota bacterium]
MKRLWAPWRMEFIQSAHREDGCLLCRLPAEGEDERNLILLRGEKTYLLLNRYPYAHGHLMVVPYRHVADLEALEAEEGAELFQLSQRAVATLRRAIRAQGFNLGVNLGSEAGTGVADHLHLHVVPRWRGDTNFMPLLAETRVMPQHLEEAYAQLAPLLREGTHG